MADLRMLKGISSKLPKTMSDGNVYYTYDDSLFHIDFIDEDGNLNRKAVNAEKANSLAENRTIALEGDVTGSASFDGSGDVVIKTKAGNEFFIKLIDIDNNLPYYVQMKSGRLISRSPIKEIKIDTYPIKMNYYEGEHFDPTGMTLIGTTKDGRIISIENYEIKNYLLEQGTNIIEIYFKDVEEELVTTIEIMAQNFDAEVELVDFEYTANSDGTYTLTAWKQTLNGEPSTELIIPEIDFIIL